MRKNKHNLYKLAYIRLCLFLHMANAIQREVVAMQQIRAAWLNDK
jgi:hypothetical protein